MIASKILKLMPASIRSRAIQASLIGRQRFCPVCHRHARKFLDHGLVTRSDALCPWCFALERHRFVMEFFEKQTDLFDGQPKRMLHVAPEFCFRERLHQHLGNGYVTGDLLDPTAMEKLDVTDIQHADNSFDVVYCSHVLEHVPDDRKAMRELRRVMNPDGWAVLLVPITLENTFEDSSVTDPAERERLFGQDDHVRRYGPDFVDRLREAGFTVKQVMPEDVVEPESATKLSIHREQTGDIYYCTK